MNLYSCLKILWVIFLFFRLADAFLDFRLYDNMAYEQGEVK